MMGHVALEWTKPGTRLRITYEAKYTGRKNDTDWAAQRGDTFQFWIPDDAIVEVLPDPLKAGDTVDQNSPEPPAGTVLLDAYEGVWQRIDDAWMFPNNVDGAVSYPWQRLVAKNSPMHVLYVPEEGQ